MSDARKVLRVFLSSTAIDMAACREKVRDTVLQLEQLPIGMETFTALPSLPAADCQAEAAQADVVLALVAHRYGYVPGADLGGDGQHSITWLEVLAAQKAGKPVYAFLIDPKVAWSQAKESDLLNTEPDEKHLEVLAAIRRLREFKAYLQAYCTFDSFTNEDDLARKVATTLSNHVRGMDPGTARPAKVWRPRVCYPLQPAPHFQGRQRLRANLLEWTRARVAPDRVVSLVAVGGTGKTALAEHVLADLGEEPPAGVMVWSLYESPRTEEFLRIACEYFTGEPPSSAGGLLERLQTALTGDEPHLLVLDGLERVQTEGTTGRPRGELEDPQLRRLLRWLAAGHGTRARALVTSRFPLVDLHDWKNAGHREERLEDLEPEAARAVLRGWGVKGDDATLDGLAAPLHYHALSVAVLGSYLGKLWGGDPTKAPTFDRGELADDDPKAARLNRILTHYAEKLPDVERDLLARLSTFPRGVTVEFLGFLMDAGGQIAGALAGCSQVRLLRLLEKLRDLGLVFRYDTPQGATFSAHPFLRDYFRELLGVTKPEEIHEAVRARLAPSLEAKPEKYPTDPVMLDRYEALIEHTRLAGRIHEAFQLYWFALGSFRHLGGMLGAYVRGLRILSAFSSDGTPEAAPLDLLDRGRERLVLSREGMSPAEILLDLPDRGCERLVFDWGLFAAKLGDLGTARRAIGIQVDLARRSDDARKLSGALQNQADIELLAGQIPAALQAAVAAVTQADKAGDRFQKARSEAYVGTASARLGNLNGARRHFAVAAELEEMSQMHFLRGLQEAEFKMAIGDRAEAAAQTQANRDFCKRSHWIGVQARCDTLLGLLALPDEPAAARQHLGFAREFAFRSGHVEVQLRCYHLAAEIARTERAHDLARSEAEAGIHLADTCGFGHYVVELRLSLARVYLAAGNPKAALHRAHEALDRSVPPECQYAWGEADGLHLCGVAHARLGEVELARQRFTAALARREQLTHPGVPETRAELARLSG
jgi:tetratricopeptide (TPR) repeat protein